MTINIRTNLASLNSQRNLSRSTAGINVAYERLSSGYRINRASDDAAGLSIAESLKAANRVAGVGIRNANDGISMINIADQALGEISGVLSRLAELAEQSANGVFNTTQRSALQNEFTALTSEIERIAYTTNFNGIKVLSGQAETTFQVGLDGSSLSRIQFTGVGGTLSSFGLAPVQSSVHTYSISGETVEQAQSAARQALDAVNLAIVSAARDRGILGATESRLIVAINNLEVAKENFQAAESRIRDADVAMEAANLARLNILQQAGTAVAGQANQQPQLALRLLGG